MNNDSSWLSDIIIAIKSGFEDKALTLLKDADTYLSTRQAIRIYNMAYRSDFARLFMWLNLKSIHRFELDRYLDIGLIFADACEKGLSEMVRALINDDRIDPTMNQNGPIRYAIYKNHMNVIKILMLDKRVNPSVLDNDALRFSCVNNNCEIVKLLMADERVDPSAFNNAGIRIASIYGLPEIVKILLSDPRVDPSVRHNEAMISAAKNGNTEVVKILLSDSRVDSLLAITLNLARGNNHLDTVKVLEDTIHKY